MKLNKLSSLILSGLISTSALAATQGSVGLTSTGSIDINATVEQLVLITNLNDIDLGRFTGPEAELTGQDNFCVSTNSSGAYTLTARGSGANDEFSLTNGGGDASKDFLDYTVSFTDGAATSTDLTANLAVNAAGAATSLNDCATGNFDNQQVSITVISDQLLNANAGDFTGTLTLTVAPL